MSSLESTGITHPVAVISTSSSGDNTIVAAITGKRIVVFQYVLTVASSVTVTWKSGSTAISGGMTVSVGLAPPNCPHGLLMTNSGEALVMNLSSGVAVGGHLTYGYV